MGKISIKELAKQLNISISTVSRALNDSHETSFETKMKVRALAEKLDYRPDIHASNLRSRKSKTIAVIIPEITNSFFSLAINGIEEIAREKGYHVLIYLTHESYSQEVGLSKLLLDGRVDGVLMSVASETTNTSHIENFNKRNIPVVLFDRICDNVDTLKVITDDYHCGYNAVRHLVDTGCKNVGYISLSRHLSIDKRRMQGFLDAANFFKIQNRVIYCGQNEKENIEHLTACLSSKNIPDGLFASVEKLGLAVYQACHTLQISIPSDLKVISFSNQSSAALLSPPLTTITQPAFEIGKRAASALFKALKNNFIFNENDEIIIPSQLIKRKSTTKTC